LRKEQSLENLSLVDRSVKDLTLTMQKFEEKEKQEGTYTQPKLHLNPELWTRTIFKSCVVDPHNISIRAAQHLNAVLCTRTTIKSSVVDPHNI
jgi:hypothetical protein